jgi:Tol biopolymer transport system component
MMLASPVTGEVRQITNDPAFNNTAFAWKPSGDALLVQRFDMQSAPGGSSIWMYDIQTGNLTAVASNGYGAAWLP